ncbi:MAG: hypothetical protein Q8P51_12690, partial [Ignavibacteria bacterium]|nr:hypothetical protein [Ignavibacteria bacterium]
MKASFLSLGILLIGLLAFSCQTQPAPLTDAQKAAVSDSAKAVMQEVFTGINKLSAAAMFQPYSSQPDVRFAEDGILYPSLDTVKAVAENFFQLLEFTTDKVDVFDVVVLGPEAAAVMAPFHFTAKTKA